MGFAETIPFAICGMVVFSYWVYFTLYIPVMKMRDKQTTTNSKFIFGLIFLVGVSALVYVGVGLKQLARNRSNYIAVAAPPPVPSSSKLNGNNGFQMSMPGPAPQNTITSPASAAGAAPIVVQGPNARNIQVAYRT
jgi:hypothetical protein